MSFLEDLTGIVGSSAVKLVMAFKNSSDIKVMIIHEVLKNDHFSTFFKFKKFPPNNHNKIIVIVYSLILKH